MIRTLAGIALTALGLWVLWALHTPWGVLPLGGAVYLSLGGGR